MKVLIISIVLLLCVIHVHSQTHPIQKPLLRGQKPYFVKDQFYNFNELEFLFQNDVELSKLHRAGVRNDAISKVFGYSTISLWGAGVIVFLSDNSHTEGLLNDGGVLGLILIVIVSPITGTIGLIANAREVLKKRKAIETYNKWHVDKYGRDIEKPTLGLSSNGVGLSIKF